MKSTPIILRSLKNQHAFGSLFRYLSCEYHEKSRLPKHKKVVICGASITGASVAYHLAELGWGPETIVLEKNELPRSLFWDTSCPVSLFQSSYPQIKLCQATIELYHDLLRKNYDIGWKKCGSISTARTSDRMTVLRRMKAQSVSWNIDCELLSPEQIKKICPLIEVSDLKGGLWIPNDGTADPYKICEALLDAAESKGVQRENYCTVQQILSQNDRVCAVETSEGAIECDYFVNCAGFSSRLIGTLSKPHVRVPVHGVQRHYLITKQIYGLDKNMPVVRDQDGFIYIKENDGCLVAGGYELVAKPVFDVTEIKTLQQVHLHEQLPFFGFPEWHLPEDWDHFEVLLEQMLHRCPTLREATLDTLINRPETFSPDGKWIMGEAPEIRNYFVAAGMKTVSASAAGGTGKTIADWIVQGAPGNDLYELDVKRFLGLHNNPKFLRDRVKEVPGLHFTIPYPYREFETGRNLRMSPIYPKLKEAGAVFGQVMGYERPNWFDINNINGSVNKTLSFNKPVWFDAASEEYTACRETVGLIDYSSYTKIDLWSNGNEVVDVLQYLCSNDVNVPIGSIIHTGIQNERGGYENDCSLVRINKNHYMMIAPTIQQTRCKAWLDRHIPKDGSVNYSDLTSMFTAICIVGPFSRKLLSDFSETDLDPNSFPFFTYKEIDVGLADGIRTMNITHTGELGYVLYVPNEFALHVYNCLVKGGEKYGLKHVGYYAMKAIRVEKFYAFWGQDLDTTTTPLECGRSWRVKFDKDFVGKDALLKQREEGVKRRYVQLILNDHDIEIDPWCCGNEPIYRNGKYAGVVTTTSYGFTLKKLVCLGFIKNLDDKRNSQVVTNEYVLSGSYEVDIGGQKFPAKVNLHSPILPTKYPDKERESYFATRDKMTSEPLLRQ